MRLLSFPASRALVLGLVVLSACSGGKGGDDGETGGTGGTGGTSSSENAIGNACEKECGGGLFCFRESEPFLEKGGVPSGLCTKKCDDASECDAGTICVRSEKEGVCVPSCAFGDDETKCLGRKELSCAPVLAKTGKACSKDEECDGEARCYEATSESASEGECRSLEAACLPRCGGDFDCAEGRFCNLGTGECDEAKRDGLPRGTSCDPALDECAGACVEVDAGRGVCEERCRIGAASGCGFGKASEEGVLCGFFAFDVGVEQGAGDTGVCASLCNCSSECASEELCLNNPIGDFAGLCATGVDAEDAVVCDGAGGAGGMGGAP